MNKMQNKPLSASGIIVILINALWMIVSSIAIAVNGLLNSVPLVALSAVIVI
jgi:hypothetical protein